MEDEPSEIAPQLDADLWQAYTVVEKSKDYAERELSLKIHTREAERKWTVGSRCQWPNSESPRPNMPPPRLSNST